MIILTWQQANQVRGLWVKGHALAPRPLRVGPNVFTSGKYGLPEACISDPVYASISALLASFPTVSDSSISDGAFNAATGTWTTLPDWEVNSTVCQANAYSASWLPGQLVPYNAVG